MEPTQTPTQAKRHMPTREQLAAIRANLPQLVAEVNAANRAAAQAQEAKAQEGINGTR